jgi:hypothetical protein
MLLDKDNSGSITPDEIADFFFDIWDVEQNRKGINDISRPVVDESEGKDFKLIEQFCKELSFNYYIDLIKSKGFTTKMLLHASFESLQAALKEVDVEHIALLYMKAKAHNDRKQFYIQIQ